jgi:NADH-quinone oxidoreductase subunit C
MSARVTALAALIAARLGERCTHVHRQAGELTIEVAPENLLEACRTLCEDPELGFEMLMDVCGVDYLDYGRSEWRTFEATGTGFSRGVNRKPTAHHEDEGRPGETEHTEHRHAPHEPRQPRFAVVYHLLSIRNNWRLRLRARCADSVHPAVDSVIGIWAAADWFEREAFDLFGILFRGHPDLRRILTDYGFIGHPFRKDFPLIGNVEVRYDPDKGRVVYQPVSIEPRTLVPKVIREDNRYEAVLKDRGPGGEIKSNG